MTFESISVRMNRSSPSIPWGFTIGGSDDGSSLCIASVEKDSLADKAGLQVNDQIIELLGRDAKMYSLRDAKITLDRDSHDFTMNLHRYLSSHPCLPWTLTEKDNKIVVDQIKSSKQPGFQSYKVNESKSEFSAHSKSTYPTCETNYSIPVRSEHYQESKSTQPTNLGYQSAPFTNVTNSSHITNVKTHMKKDFEKTDTANIYTKKEKTWDEKGAEAHPSHRSEGVKELEIKKLRGSYGAPTDAQFVPPPREKHELSSFPQTYAPVHLNTGKYGTSHHGSNIQYQSQKSPSGATHLYDEEGNIIRFQHSPRTRRQLSPTASIQHLQYNSPMNIYSHESAAEQYLKQTGGLFGTDSHAQKDIDAPYLTSETRRLIAEQESDRNIRSHSPSAQSASFKRIARACGTPVD